MRSEYEELDDSIAEYEQYIEENGLPYCDYKLHRGQEWDISPIEKFQNGIHRIIRIVKSYKANTFTDLLKKVQEKVKQERDQKMKKWRMKTLKTQPQNFEDKVEKMMLEQQHQIELLTDLVKSQNKSIISIQKHHRFTCKHCGVANEISKIEEPDDVDKVEIKLTYSEDNIQSPKSNDDFDFNNFMKHSNNKSQKQIGFGTLEESPKRRHSRRGLDFHFKPALKKPLPKISQKKFSVSEKLNNKLEFTKSALKARGTLREETVDTQHISEINYENKKSLGT